MPDVGSAALPIYPTFKGLQGNLERGTDKALTAAGLTGGAKFGDSAGRSMSSKFGSHVKKAAKVAAVGLAAAGAVAFKFAGDSLQEAREAQKIGAQTNAVIRSTGKAAKVTAGDVGRLSGRLSDKAGIDDELIQSGANVLLTFTKIRNETGKGNAVFDQATKAALDMSVALGSDMKGASIQVGKALNDPIKGVTALGRAGVQFSEDQKAAIKRLVETGDTLGAQKIILRELDRQFKGSARAQATESDKLGVAFGNLKEDVGTALIPVMDDLAVFLRKKGIPAARDFAGWVRDDLAPAVKNAAEDVKPLVDGAKDLAKFLNDIPGPAKIAGITALLTGGAALKLRGGRGGALGTVGSALGIAKPVPVFVTNPGFNTPGTDAPGGGGRSKWLGLLGGLAKGLSLPVFSGAGTIAAHKSLAKGVGEEKASAILTGATTPGGGGFGAGVFSSDDFFPEKAATGGLTTLEKFSQVLAHARGETLRLDDTLDLVGAKKINPSFTIPGLRESKTSLEDFIRMGDKARQPISPHVQLTGVEQARAQIAGLLASIPGPGALAGIGVAGSVAATSQRRGTPAGERSDRGGVHFNGDIHVTAQDPNQFLTEVDKRRRRAQLDGVNRP